jgi:hypothetical protein
MKRLLLLILISLLLLSCKEEVVYTNQQLIEVINNYRKEKKLPAIAVSPSLNKVAQIHINDLIAYHVPNEGCNLHSWSKHGKWSPCCYDDSHSSSKCMWDKPRELTSYKGDGYEIAVFHSEGMTPELALELWKSSPGHLNMILNRNKWKKVKWKAIGAAIKGDYALVWFGRVAEKKKK